MGALQAAVVRASSQTALESAALRLFNMAADCTALCHICRQKGWPESKTASMQQEANHLPVRYIQPTSNSNISLESDK